MRSGVLLGVLAVVAVGGAIAVLARQTASPLLPAPRATAPDAPAATDPVVAAPAVPPVGDEPVDRRAEPPRPGEWTPAAASFLARAAGDPLFTVVVAEVLRVGTIARAAIGEGTPEHQDVRLRILGETDDAALRRRATVDAPLCPATSQELHGVSTPFGNVVVGQVRTFVFGRGRPDLGALSKLLGHRARWLVLAGPEAPRPHDPVLAAVPPELHGWLGRPLCNVFRARVGEARSGLPADRPGAGLGREFGRVVVDVLEVVQHGGRLPLRDRITLAPEPFVPGPDMRAISAGGEYWFVTDDAALFHVLRAFAPAR